jgi:hypothetical protein
MCVVIFPLLSFPTFLFEASRAKTDSWLGNPTMLITPAPPSSSPRSQIDTATLEILNPKLTPLITLTAADRKWMDELVTLVDSSYNPSDPARPLGQGFVGSDDFLRGKFEEYVCSLLACVKFGEFLGRERGERAEMLLSAPGASFLLPSSFPFLLLSGRGNTRRRRARRSPSLFLAELESYNPSSFNESFINAFKRTTAYELWDRNTDEAIFDLVEPKCVSVPSPFIPLLTLFSSRKTPDGGKDQPDRRRRYPPRSRPS